MVDELLLLVFFVSKSSLDRVTLDFDLDGQGQFLEEEVLLTTLLPLAVGGSCCFSSLATD